MEDIKREIESVKKSIEVVSNEISSVYEIKDRIKRAKRLDVLFEQERTLFKKQKELEEKLNFSLPPTKSNNIIDLRHAQYGPHSYLIYLHNTSTAVGEISYRGYHTSDFLGDIGYTIDEKFRGNNYAYQALSLLSEKLKEDGITDFWVGVYSHNIPSIKTIEKYGGKIIKNTNGAVLFQCETRNVLENDNIMASKR